MIKTAIVGCGYWGTNLARNFAEADQYELSYLFDVNQEVALSFSKAYPKAQVISSMDDLLGLKDLDAVALTTPASTHYSLAKRIMLAGKSVLVEKPASMSAEQMNELHTIAKQQQVALMVDHTFLYGGPIQAIKQLLESNALGDILYLDSVRINLGKIQRDINVIWDLAPHDFSILNYLLGSEPTSIQVNASEKLPNGMESVAFVTLQYPKNILAHINVSWSSPVKRRELIISGSKKMIVYDDLNQQSKVTLYNCGHDLMNSEDGLQVNYRASEPEFLSFDNTEPLRNVVHHFSELIKNPSMVSAKANFDVGILRLLETAQESIDTKGAVVFL